MRKLLVVLYWGREGSSAIIEGLSSSNEVYVPVFEEFDSYQFSEKFQGRELLSTMMNIEEEQELYIKFNKIKKQRLKDYDVICFKWRPWDRVDILDNLSLKYDLHVILLTRKYSYIHAIRHLSSALIYEKLSLPLQQIISKDLHVQFLKSHKQYPELIDTINSIRVDIDEENLIQQTRNYCNFKKMIHQHYILNKGQYKSRIIFFENYVNDIQGTQDEIAEFIGIQKFPVTVKQRGSDLDLSKVVNDYSKLIANPSVIEINEDYLMSLRSHNS